jgi:DMSO/TMAO reductase YedYZ molybdopterin-dependent catalytic subunit
MVPGTAGLRRGYDDPVPLRSDMFKRLVITLTVLAVLSMAPFGLWACGDTDFLDLDPDTSLHVTGRAIEVDIASYRLKVSGKVDQEISLEYDEIVHLTPKVTGSPDLVCPGYFVDKASWSGVPFKTVLDVAGVRPDAAWVRMKSADGFSIKVELEVALRPDSFLAYELEGQRLPVEHGFPLRAVLPGQDGARWVKWITELALE